VPASKCCQSLIERWLKLIARELMTIERTPGILEQQADEGEPAPKFNFTEIPRVVGGPYEYGVPGARHALMADEEGQPEGGREEKAGR
jgi:hypothetical protein